MNNFGASLGRKTRGLVFFVTKAILGRTGLLFVVTLNWIVRMGLGHHQNNLDQGEEGLTRIDPDL